MSNKKHLGKTFIENDERLQQSEQQEKIPTAQTAPAKKPIQKNLPTKNGVTPFLCVVQERKPEQNHV